ncbi:MAG TPA: HAD-IIA family hydrolase [Pedococcus sp.]|jgi:HAD superfamily hydrolase (TIGR01450 family)
MPLLQRYRGVVCDLDGVVYRGPLAVVHAVEAIRAAQVPVLYATNNASRTPDEVAAHLRDLGLDHVGADAVVTSSQAGARHLARRHGTGVRVLAVGGPGVAEALAREGLAPVAPVEAAARPCVAVLQGYGANVTAADLAEAAYAVQAGAEWVATNTDGTLPTDRGTAPGNGTLVAAVARACGTDPLVVGKPHAPLYELCAEVAGLATGELLAVGDRLDTDIAGAVATGMDSALVLTGVDGPASLVLAPPAQRPTYLLADLRGLHADYLPAVLAADGTWSCGGHARRLVDGRWEAPGRSTREAPGEAPEVEELRCVVAALHEALDRGTCSEADALRLLSEAGVAQ